MILGKNKKIDISNLIDPMCLISQILLNVNIFRHILKYL